jgi:predicted methyltransferase
MQTTGRQISNVELHNTQTFADALALASRPEQNVLRERKMTVQQRLEMKKLPPNMHWIPSKRDLIASIVRQHQAVSNISEAVAAAEQQEAT